MTDKVKASLDEDVSLDLGAVMNQVPETVFLGRVSRYGARRTKNAVIRWLLDTHPVAAEILGKETSNDSVAGS